MHWDQSNFQMILVWIWTLKDVSYYMTHLLCKCSRHFCAWTLDIKVKLSLVSMTALSNLTWMMHEIKSGKVTKYLLFRQNKVGKYCCQLSWHFLYWATNKFNIQKYQSFYVFHHFDEREKVCMIYSIFLWFYFLDWLIIIYDYF